MYIKFRKKTKKVESSGCVGAFERYDYSKSGKGVPAPKNDAK